MVDDDEIRWKHFNLEIPRRMGKIEDLQKFDATFFGVHFKQAHTMDPQCRLLIETAYEAVLGLIIFSFKSDQIVLIDY